MGEALIAFDKMLDDVATWAEGSTAYEQREANGSIERRDYDMVTAVQAIKAAQAAIDGDGDEQAAAERLLDVVRAAQWHTIDDEQGGAIHGDESTAGGS